MPRPVKPPSAKRAYSSPTRAANAEATRKTIVETATRLFTADGYVKTTIQSVADEARVAVQTVYANFGNKRELLRQVLEAAVTGDADPLPLPERAVVLAIADEPDARRRAALDAKISAKISPRVAPIARVIREAAAIDPEFAAIAAQITDRRRRDMAAAVKLLTGTDGPTLDIEDAIGTLYVLYSPDVFTMLTENLGWSLRKYERWLAEMLYRTVMS